MAYDQKSVIEILYLVSRRNIAHYYREELQRIVDGESAIHVLPNGPRKTLMYYHILLGGKRRGSNKVCPCIHELYEPNPELEKALASLWILV